MHAVLNGDIFMSRRYTDSEFGNIKRREREVIEQMLEELKKSKDKRYLFKEKHVVTDLKDMLNYSADEHPDLPLFMQKYSPNQPFKKISFRQAREDVNAIGTSLLDLGLEDRNIGLIGRNSSEWGESYLAIVGGVGVVVPLDRELNQSELEQLTVKGEMEAVITINNKYYEIFKAIKADGRTRLRYVLNADMDEHEDEKNGLLSWQKLREEGRHKIWDGDRRYIDAQVVNTDLASIIFTSGTTGVSKGVMLSHRNLMLDTMLVQSMFEARPKDICFSVLPMHHCYECTATFLSCVYSGATVAFSRGLKYIRKDILEVQPTIMLAVPAIIENFHNKIRRSMSDRLNEKQMQVFELMDREASRFKVKLPKKVTKDIAAVFGGRLHTLISGGAPIDGAILDSFCNIGFNAIQGYGLSECSPIVALNPAKRKYMKNASAGHIMPFTECRILDPDSNGIGEICFRGPQIMMGYYKDEENTKAVIDEEGWFHTGDIGYLDRDNYVFITGRKKNVIIASNGKNVFPEELESYLLASKYIEECMVWGGELDPNSQWSGIHATIRVDKEAIERELGGEYTENQVSELIEREVDKINDSMPRFKKIAHVIIRDREFDKTTTNKIRRFVEDNKRA